MCHHYHQQHRDIHWEQPHRHPVDVYSLTQHAPNDWSVDHIFNKHNVTYKALRNSRSDNSVHTDRLQSATVAYILPRIYINHSQPQTSVLMSRWQWSLVQPWITCKLVCLSTLTVVTYQNFISHIRPKFQYTDPTTLCRRPVSTTRSPTKFGWVRLGFRQVCGICLVVDMSDQSRHVWILSVGLVGSQTKSVGPCSGI